MSSTDGDEPNNALTDVLASRWISL